MASRAMMASRSAAAAGAESSTQIASRKTTKTTVITADGSGNVSRETHTKVEGSSSADVHVAAMRRMEEKIRVLMDDLESEQQLRRRVEREKQDLQMQVGERIKRLLDHPTHADVLRGIHY